LKQLLENLIPVMKSNGKGQIVLMKSVDSMMNTRKNRVPTIISQYGCEGLYASSMDKLREMGASEAVKTTMVRVYPEVVEYERGQKKPKGTGFFGNMDAKLAAEIIVNGVKNNYKEFAAPYSAVFIESFVGMMPLSVGLKVRELLYRN
jgi:short-subunit dehydrogenase